MRKLTGFLAIAAVMSMIQTATAEISTDPLDNPSAMSPRSLHLMSAKVVAVGGRLISVGERGTILLSDDQGRSWRQAPSPVRVTLTALSFADSSNGWAVGHGGIILATRDGGNTWTRQLDGVAAAKIELEQAKADLASAADPERANRRVREAEGLVADGPDKPFLDVHFFDADHGLAVGAYGLAFATEDGGKTWGSVMGHFDNQKGRHLYAIDVEGDTLIIAGEQGTLFKSADRGKSFQSMQNPGRGTYFGVISDPQGVILAFGLRGALFRSADGGAKWEKISVTSASLTAGRRLDDGSLILADETGQVFKSADGGKSFTPLAQSGGGGISAIAQANTDALIVAGARGNVRLAMDHGQSEGNDK